MYLALSLVGYDEEIKAAMAYVFGTTFVCDNMDNAKKVEIKSVFNILPLYNEGQKSWDAHLPCPRAMLYFLYPRTLHHHHPWICHRTLNPVLKSFVFITLGTLRCHDGDDNENVKKQ